MWQWLRRRFITGFFVTVPLVVSVLALVWVFRLAMSLSSGVAQRVFQTGGAGGPWERVLPFLGLVATALLVLGVGIVATNVFGRRVLNRSEALLLQVPVFRTIYAPVRQLIAAFSPDNESGFKRVVLVEDPSRGFVLGFLTKEFTIDRGDCVEDLIAVYVPTNHLYLGDVTVFPRSRASFPNLTVEQGISIFLTGGMAVPSRLQTRTPDEPASQKTQGMMSGPPQNG